MRDPCGDELFCILTVPMSIFWLYYCITTLQDVMDEEYMGVSLYHLLQLHVSLQLSQNKKRKEKKMWTEKAE